MMPYDDTHMDHAAYQKRVRSMTDEALHWTMKDAREAAAAMPAGRKVHYYLDEVLYCAAELRRLGGDAR